MRLLVLDHFFDQDIDALVRAGGPEVDVRVWPYHDLRWEALRVFPEEVATGLEPFARDEMAPLRERWALRLGRLLEERFTRAPFDAFVAPSDVFFYVRAAPQICHRLGVPFFVAQKETTISPHTMGEHAARVARWAPPVADHMTVCSERHREFWLRAGAAPERVTVTGQPRFDFYAHPERWPASRADEPPTVLFFSYHVDAYHPSEGAQAPVWRELHRQTERGLYELAARGWRVLVKPHPQQSVAGVRRRLRRELPASIRSRVQLVSPQADARELIMRAAVVVGFQTTALLEAMLAGKPVVYTGWDEEAHRVASALIPFDRWQRGIDVVRDAAELAATIEAAHRRPVDPATMDFRRAVVAEQLGPVDGRAAERTLTVLRGVVEEFARRRAPEAVVRRRTLAARRPARRLGRVALMKLDFARAALRVRA
jgi:glycosyltransferase involved in cell wall biosynthesis